MYNSKYFSSNKNFFPSILTLILLLFSCLQTSAQESQNIATYLETLEGDIVFNNYLTDENKVDKLTNLIEEVQQKKIEKKALFLKYAQVNKSLAKNETDKALYEFVELTESCDTTDNVELQIYLGSTLQIGATLREHSANELAFQYISNGIKIIEDKNLNGYPWIKDFYNDAGVDLLSMGEIEKSRSYMLKAASLPGNRDHFRDAMIEYNVSFLYFELNILDSAIHHQKNAILHLEKIENLSSYPEIYSRYANSLGSLAIFYYSNNNLDLAQSTALQAKNSFKEVDTYDSGRYPHLFTLINLSIDNHNQAQTYTLIAEIDSVLTKIEKGKHHFYQLLSNSYKLIGNSAKENEYLNLAYRQFQKENASVIHKLQKYNSQLQSQILQREKIRFENERAALSKKAFQTNLIISLIFLFLISVLYMLYIRARNKKNLLQKEKEIHKIEYEKNEIKTRLTESELNEKKLVTNRLASHIKLKQQTEAAFLQKIKELKRNKPQNIEAEISELHVKMINLINIDQNFEHTLHVDDLNQEFRNKLKQNHPELNDKELHFCSLLLLDLTAKEIGSITNKSDGAVRVYKNRLKNKLVGEQDIDLIDYLQNI